jgi:dihydroorotase
MIASSPLKNKKQKNKKMKKILIMVISGLILVTAFVQAQTKAYSILIKGGHVIDAKNNINEIMDVAIQNGKIAAVAKNINPMLASQIVDAKGMYVTPGLIDLHGHVFAGTEPNHYLSNGNVAVAPDGFTFRAGVTTIVDAGGAGWKSFPDFKRNIIDLSKTRVLSFLNIVGEGMRGGAYEQDISDMDSKKAAETALAYKNYIVGFKLAHFRKLDWTPVERIMEAGKQTNLPVIIDFGGNLSLEELFFKYLRPGDIYTHVFRELSGKESIVDLKTKQLKSFVLPAQEKGIIFDVGFGGGSFNFNQAISSIKAGFYPNTMGTDLHGGSMNGAMKDQLNVLSTFLALDMDIPGVISRSTWEPAKAINREELGNLSVGSEADIAVLRIRKGNFGFKDIAGNKQVGKRRFECEMTIREGKVVYDLNAIASTPAGRR